MNIRMGEAEKDNVSPIVKKTGHILKHNIMKKARILLISSMAIFGTIGYFVRNIPISSGELALCRAVLAACLLGVYILLSGSRIDFSAIKREIPLLLLSGIAMGINWIFLFEAYKYTTVSLATLSYYFAPTVVTAVCPFLFKEKLSVKQIICFCMSTLGVIMIVGTGRTGDGHDLTGILLGLCAALFYATVILMNKFIKNVTGIHRTFLQFIASITVLVPYIFATGGLHLDVLDSRGWINLLIVGLFHTGITYCMYFSSLKELAGQEAAILSYIDPLVAVIVSVVALGEDITLPQIIGGAVILFFAKANNPGQASNQIK